MQTEQPWYIGLRAESLAIVYLTRRDDLIISREQKEQDLDILVSIDQNAKYIDKLFGVQVKATESSLKIVQYDDIFKIEEVDINAMKSLSRKFHFPICLFFFTLDNDKGYYKWIFEPIIDKNNDSKLLFNSQNEFKQITDNEINNIILSVDSWYNNQPIRSTVLAELPFSYPKKQASILRKYYERSSISKKYYKRREKTNK